MTQDFTVIHFYPVMKCYKSSCDRSTHTAVIEGENFEPVCYEHGGVFIEEETSTSLEHVQQEYASVERYILSIHDDKGVCVVIGPVQLHEVPGYTGQEDARAWYVRHDVSSASTFYYVVWDADDAKFLMVEAK